MKKMLDVILNVILSINQILANQSQKSEKQKLKKLLHQLMYKIGDKVIFKAQSYKQYAWRLNDFEEYIIIKMAFSDETTTDYIPNTMYYGVRDKNGVESTWFEYDDFITLKKYRKQKLRKINGIALKS
jgi:hypothetical protein